MTRAASKPNTADGSAALLGQRVAFTGRFATFSRPQAESLVVAAKGTPIATVSSRASMLVVGMRGWPLMESGQITRKLASAERLRAAGKLIRIVPEVEFRELLGLDPPASQGDKTLSNSQVCSALGIDGRVLERWERCGLVRSSGGCYDFRDLVSLRTVTNLVARGVSPVVIRKSLDTLGGLLPGVDRPLAQLNILLSDSGELVAELEEALLTQSGQLEIRFDPPRRPAEARTPLSLTRADTRDAAAWIDAGLEHEEAGEADKAEHAYRRAAALAPNDAIPQFNLGNILMSAGRLEAAAERFAQATALDPSHAEAWFNLGHVYEALKDAAAALRCLRRAVAADPKYADAQFNLADLATRLGERESAVAAWTEYLRLDPGSEWSAEARRRLEALRSTKWA